MAEKYNRGRTLGKGTFAVVYEGERRSDGQKVAIKQMKGQESISGGVDFTGLREIKYLQSLRSGPGIVGLLDVFIMNEDLCLVLEYCPWDLQKVICDKTILLRTQHHKSYLQMLLYGVHHCHSHYILHRDLKPANLLFSPNGQMKIADFGLARSHGSFVKMTAKTVTLWYRAPELAFGSNYYSAAVDMWAVGCIFAEIVLRTPLFAVESESDVDLLARIFNVLGTPTDETWPNVRLLPNYIEFDYREALNLSQLFRSESGALDLLLRMLTLNPSKRISAAEALQHSYFTQQPSPCPAAELPVPA